MSVLSVERLNVSVSGTPILKDVSLKVGKGEIVAVTGESGSGKSMTAFSVMRLLAESLTIDSGRISICGTDTLSLSDREMCRIRGAKAGMVFQEPMTALNPVRTIGDQVSEAILLQEDVAKSEARDRAARLLERVGLPHERFPLSRYPHELSGGQRQRVVIAIAIALRPELLIADEPTTALDVTTQAQILDLLKSLVREFGMGLLIITHDLAVVAGLADRLVVMRHGEVVEEGPARTVLSEQRHPYTAALIEASGHKVDLAPVSGARDVPILRVEGVTCSYAAARKNLLQKAPRNIAVKDVGFELNKGERLGLVGESGCGKSTLTRAVLGLLEVDKGVIEIAGKDIHDARGMVQVVFQDPYGSFNPRHRVSRLVTEPFHLLRNPPRGKAKADRVAEVLEAVGLTAEDADKYIHEFSGGQRQRIAIARALVIEPELIIFDEAVSALDVSVRAKILDLLADLSRRYGLSYLFISHDLHVVATVTDRVMVMKSGEIVESGATGQIFDNPQHPYTRELLQAAPKLDVEPRKVS